MISRRQFFLATSAGVGMAALALSPLARSLAQESGEVFELTHTEDEWRAILAPRLPGDPDLGDYPLTAFQVLRQEATEYPYSHAYATLYQDGMYHCRGCDLALYSSEHKYDSHTGWPSFWQAQDNAVRTKVDMKIGYPRTEVHCRRCGGHLGHIFSDGPPPTGDRHCINALSLRFVAA